MTWGTMVSSKEEGKASAWRAQRARCRGSKSTVPSCSVRVRCYEEISTSQGSSVLLLSSSGNFLAAEGKRQFQS